MAVIGFHASHEQLSPGFLLTCLKRAEHAGFKAASCSDHFHPWSETGGESGFAWSWLGSALEATSLSLGVVSAPGQRYHPAILAQAVATLLQMYPGRFWLAVGSGENLNEHITGDEWPAKEVRNRRLKESVEVMKALWSGKTVSHRGTFTIEDATLYTLPASRPLIAGAALTAETAYFLGGFADGLITAGKKTSDLRRVVEAFREGGGDGKPLILQVALAFGESDEDALASVHQQWRVAGLTPSDLSDLKTPALFDAATAGVGGEVLLDKFRVSADWRKHLDWIRSDIELGFDAIFLSHVGRDVERFIDVFGEHVLPHCNSTREGGRLTLQL
jgi:coenzyme F420-dependent glucose-6-phosphate dehydrogenase